MGWDPASPAKTSRPSRLPIVHHIHRHVWTFCAVGTTGHARLTPSSRRRLPACAWTSVPTAKRWRSTKLLDHQRGALFLFLSHKHGSPPPACYAMYARSGSRAAWSGSGVCTYQRANQPARPAESPTDKNLLCNQTDGKALLTLPLQRRIQRHPEVGCMSWGWWYYGGVAGATPDLLAWVKRAMDLPVLGTDWVSGRSVGEKGERAHGVEWR